MTKHSVIKLAGLFWVTISLITGLLACSRPAPPSEIRIEGGPAGGQKYLRMEGIAQAIRAANPGWQVRVLSGGVSIGALNSMAKGELELDALAVEFVVEAEKGTFGGDPLEKGPLKLSNIAPSYFATAGILVLDKVPVNSIAEIKQKQLGIKISVGPKSTFEIRNRRVLEAYGITYEDIERWGGKIIFQGDTPTMDMMRDGLADAFVNFGTHPSALARELAANRPLKFLTVTDSAAIDFLEKKYGYIKTTLKAGIYPFVKNDVATVMSVEALIGPTALSEDTGYNIARAIWTQREFLGGVHPLFKQTLIPEYVQILEEEERKFKASFHPGAKKYFKEQGLVK